MSTHSYVTLHAEDGPDGLEIGCRVEEKPEGCDGARGRPYVSVKLRVGSSDVVWFLSPPQWERFRVIVPDALAMARLTSEAQKPEAVAPCDCFRCTGDPQAWGGPDYEEAEADEELPPLPTEGQLQHEWEAWQHVVGAIRGRFGLSVDDFNADDMTPVVQALKAWAASFAVLRGATGLPGCTHRNGHDWQRVEGSPLYSCDRCGVVLFRSGS